MTVTHQLSETLLQHVLSLECCLTQHQAAVYNCHNTDHHVQQTRQWPATCTEGHTGHHQQQYTPLTAALT